METAIVAAVALAAVVTTAALAFLERRRSDAAWRAQVERLERLLAAKTLGEAAAVERMYASPPMSEEKPEAEPDEVAQLFADPPRRKE